MSEIDPRKKAERYLKQNSTDIKTAVKLSEQRLKVEKEAEKSQQRQISNNEKLIKQEETKKKKVEEQNKKRGESASRRNSAPEEQARRKAAVAASNPDSPAGRDKSKSDLASSIGGKGEWMRNWAQARPSVRAGMIGGKVAGGITSKLGASAGMAGGVAKLATGGIAAGIEAIKKSVEVLAQASPSFGASLKLINKALMMFLRPIGDLLGAFLRPMARMMIAANRVARNKARATGARPGSVEYTTAYMGALGGELYKGIFSGLKQILDQYGLGWIADVLKLIYDAVIWYWTQIFNALMLVWQGIAWFFDNVVKPIGEFLYNALRPVFEAIYNVLVTLWNVFVTNLTKIYNFLAGFVQTALNSISNVIGGVKWFLEQVYNVLNWIYQAVCSFIGGVGNFVSDPVGSTASALGINGRVVPWFAEGATVSGGKALVGLGDNPAGIEHIVPEEKKFDFAQKVLGNSGSNTSVKNTTLNLNAPVFGVNDLEKKVKQIMNQAALDSRRR